MIPRCICWRNVFGLPLSSPSLWEGGLSFIYHMRVSSCSWRMADDDFTTESFTPHITYEDQSVILKEPRQLQNWKVHVSEVVNSTMFSTLLYNSIFHLPNHIVVHYKVRITYHFRIDVGEITFTKYPIEYLKKTGSDELCVTFQDGRGSQRKCSEYFLLVADRYR